MKINKYKVEFEILKSDVLDIPKFKEWLLNGMNDDESFDNIKIKELSYGKM